MKRRIDAYWQQKSDQEKKAFIGLFVVVLVAAIWLGLISPILSFKAELTEKQQKLSVISQQIVQLAPYANIATAPTTAKPLPLNEVVDLTAKRSKMTIKESQLIDGVMLLSLESVPFEQLTIWLAELEDKHQITVESFEVTPVKNKPGLLSVKNLRLTQLSEKP